MASLILGKSNKKKKTVDPRLSLNYDNDGRNHDVSTWVPEISETLPTGFEQPENPYSNRILGKSKKRQEADQLLSQNQLSRKKM